MSTGHGCRRVARAGLALLWIVVGVLLVLLGWGLSRAFLLSATRSESHVLVEAALCQSLAESAVAELEAQVGYAVNDLRSPLALSLRRQVLAGERGDLSLVDHANLRVADRLLDLPIYRGYQLESVNCRVASQRQIDKVPYEKTGLVLFSATAASPGLVRKVRRTVELARRIKTTILTVPRPFGNHGLFFADGSGLMDVDAVNQLFSQAIDLCRRVRTSLKAMIERSGEPFKTSYQQILKKMCDPDQPGSLPRPLSMPNRSVVYGIARPGAEQDLTKLELGREMAAQVDKASTSVSRLEKSLTRVGSSDPSVHSDLTGIAYEACSAALGPIYTLWTFEQEYVVLSPTDLPAYKDVQEKLYKLAPDYFERRAHWRLTETAGREDLSQAFRALADQNVNGVVIVENRKYPLKLGGRIPGDMIVAVGPAGVSIQDLNAGNSRSGLVTVYASSGTVRVLGENRASLILGSPRQGEPGVRLEIEADARILGALVMVSPSVCSPMQGTLEFDALETSGFTTPDGEDHPVLERFFVGFSPRVFFRRVVIP